MIETLYKLIICHMVGDYVLQLDFIAKTKGTNWWHLIVHCFLYSLPFYLAFGWTWQLCAVIGTHIIVDALKARWKKIRYVADQILHLAVAMSYFLQ